MVEEDIPVELPRHDWESLLAVLEAVGDSDLVEGGPLLAEKVEELAATIERDLA